MWNVIRGMFAAIDGAIYSLISSLYILLMKLTRIEIFSHETIQGFATRIYAILGIFMAFKLILTFLNYIASPDSMTDAKTGGKALVTNILVALILLVATPSFIFPMARKLQSAILEENILQRIVLGVNQTITQESMAQTDRNTGRQVAFATLNSFIYPSPDVCDTDKIGFYEDPNVGDKTFKGQDANDDFVFKLDGECAEAIAEQSPKDAKAAIETYERAFNQKSIKTLLGQNGQVEIIKVKADDGEYIFEYQLLVSTAVGIAVAWMLFMFCFEIAVRTIKLGFLELIAPIPIISYIDAKTKEKSFNGWVKNCTSTYLDLFIRLIALYFAIFIISSISGGHIRYEDGTSVTGMPLLFIIIGALMFASQVPKLINDIFGTNLEGKFSLNPLKKSPLAAGAVGLGVGAAGGFAANAWNMHRKGSEAKTKLSEEGKLDGMNWFQKRAAIASEANSGHTFKRLGGLVTGGVSAGLKGAKASTGGDFMKGAGAGVAGSVANRKGRIASEKSGVTVKERFITNPLDKFSGTDNEYAGVGKMDSNLNVLNNQISDIESDESSARLQIQKFLSDETTTGAEDIEKAFARSDIKDGDGMGELEFLGASGATAYDKYQTYCRTNTIAAMSQTEFDKYSRLDGNKHHYNKKKESKIKEKKKLEKVLQDKKKAEK